MSAECTLRNLVVSVINVQKIVKLSKNFTKLWQKQFWLFYARKQLLLSARLSHRNSVCPSVCHTGGSVKNGAS